jgi:hypothetical protein
MYLKPFPSRGSAYSTLASFAFPPLNFIKDAVVLVANWRTLELLTLSANLRSAENALPVNLTSADFKK